MQPLQIDKEQQKAVDDVSRFIVRFGMTIPAIVTLESLRPLNFVGSQFMHILSPAVTAFLSPNSWNALAKLLEERQGIDYLINRLEELDAEDNQP